MLQIRNLSACYGSILALKGVDIEVKEGEMIAVVGPNGAGKTTLLRSISGLTRICSGEIVLEGNRIDSLEPHQIARLRVAHCMEGRRLFAQQSVKDNLFLGAYPRRAEASPAEILLDIEAIFELFPRLKERRSQLAGTLSGGEQQMLAIGRALMLKPKLLLLDEPSTGLAPLIFSEVFRCIRHIRDARWTTILLVEQFAYRALSMADRGCVLEDGRVVLRGTGTDLLEDPKVRQAYLGVGGDHR